MLRRSLLRRCAEEGERKAFPDPGGYGMKLEDAYKTFGYRFGDTIEKQAIKDRFTKLAKQKHPDGGGSNEEFLKLKEAHKLMMTHAHDPKTNGPANKKREVKFEKVRHGDVLNSVTWENAEENRQVSPADVAMGGFITVSFFVAYYLWISGNVMRASDGRSRMTEDEVKPMNEEAFKAPSHTWHPWKSSAEMRDQVVLMETERERRLKITRDSAAA